VIQHTIRGQHDGPRLLITGGVHGDEFEPIAAIRRLIEFFNTKQQADLHGQVTLVPIVNEAAFLRGHRFADDGLDLARTCPGRADGTVTEQTAFALSRLIRDADYYIDLHTGGTEFSVHPLAGYMLHENSTVLELQRRMAGAFNLPIVWGTCGKLDGRSLSIARDANVPAIYCEYLGGATCSPAGVAAYVDGCLNVMHELDMLTRDRPAYRVQYNVEDARPSSGHLQVRHPSPVDGYFEPSVGLGDRVNNGASIGTVFGLEPGHAHRVHSENSGIVIVLRTFPRVRAGESVGAVLDLTPTDSNS